jgi:hypothetical protein
MTDHASTSRAPPSQPDENFQEEELTGDDDPEIHAQCVDIFRDLFYLRITKDEAIRAVRAIGASSDLIPKIWEQVSREQTEKRMGKRREPLPDPDPGYDNDDDHELQPSAEEAAQALKSIVDDAAWARVRDLIQLPPAGRSSQPNEESAEGVPAPEAPTRFERSTGLTKCQGVSQALLLGIPRLKKIKTQSSDPILAETWRIRRLVGSERSIDPFIEILQQDPLDDPIPISLRRDIVYDKKVNFEKLFATMEPGYDHSEERKDLVGEYAVFKKGEISKKKPIIFEIDWCRVFDAWRAAVLVVYEHRSSELDFYRKFIIRIFRSSQDDRSRAIIVDSDIREYYAKAPFRMDDPMLLNPFLWYRIMSGGKKDSSAGSGGSNSTLSKRIGSSSAPNPAKKRKVPCINWNLNRCPDPCRNGRKHDTCSECGQGHRAADVEACKSGLEAGRRKSTLGGTRA